jgi:hypothetical protein
MTAAASKISAIYHNLLTFEIESGVDASDHIKAFNELAMIKQFMEELRVGVGKWGKYKIAINMHSPVQATFSHSAEIDLSIMSDKKYRVAPGALENLLNKPGLTDAQIDKIWDNIDNFTDREKQSGGIYEKFSIQRNIYHEFAHCFFEKPSRFGLTIGSTNHTTVDKHVNEFMFKHYEEQYRGDYNDTLAVAPYKCVLATKIS